MICKVRQALEQYGMLSGGTVTVGLSGGADSVALLDILLKLRDEYGFTLSAAHVNHCLRGAESDADEQFVRRLCEERRVPLTVRRADVAAIARESREGLEECGRRIRYEFFDSLPTDKIATAHTLSDAVETMLLNLMRGCSASGLCSIPPVRGRIIRPLILCTGQEVRDYCRKNSLNYVVDSSNDLDEYLRNRVRHHVVPSLRELAPHFEKNAGACLESLREENAFLERLCDRLLKDAEREEGYDVGVLLSADKVILNRAVYKLLYTYAGVMPERKHILLLEQAMHGGKRCQLCGGVFCESEDGVLRLFRGMQQKEAPPSFCVDAHEGENLTPCSVVRLQKVDRLFYTSLSPRERACRCFDEDKAAHPLVIRSRRPGDKLTDAHRGNTKTLKKLFTETKLPIERRDSIAVIADGENTVFVEGFCTDQKYSVDDKTENIIFVTIERKVLK